MFLTSIITVISSPRTPPNSGTLQPALSSGTGGLDAAGEQESGADGGFAGGPLAPASGWDAVSQEFRSPVGSAFL
jgi:hypothetical protein